MHTKEQLELVLMCLAEAGYPGCAWLEPRTSQVNILPKVPPEVGYKAAEVANLRPRTCRACFLAKCAYMDANVIPPGAVPDNRGGVGGYVWGCGPPGEDAVEVGKSPDCTGWIE